MSELNARLNSVLRANGRSCLSAVRGRRRESEPSPHGCSRPKRWRVVAAVIFSEVPAARLRSLAVVCVALSLAVVVGDPASASPPDVPTRWSIVPSPNEEGETSEAAQSKWRAAAESEGDEMKQPLRSSAYLSALFLMSSPVPGERAKSPAIDSVAPSRAARSERLIILGTDFGTKGAGFVLIDDRPAIATTWLPNEIHAYVPEAASLGEISVRVVTSEGSSGNAVLAVTARPSQGRVRWRFKTDGDQTFSQFVKVGPDGTIYTQDNLATYAVSPDGALLWASRDCYGADGNGGRPISIGSDGTLYCGMDIVGNAYAAVVALDPADGSVKWRFVAPNTAPIDVGPNVGPDGNIYGVQSVAPNNGLGSFALDPQGNLIWSNPGNPTIGALTSITKSEITFGVDRLHAGTWFLRSGYPVLYTFSLAGSQLWTSWDLQNTGATFPTMDPFNRVITAWPQTGLRAITADGVEDWIRIHPDQVNIERPAVDSLGNSYTGSASGVRLWSLDPAGNTRWIRPPEFPNGLDELGITPDDQIIVAGGGGGFGARAWVRGYSTADGSLLWQVNLRERRGLFEFTSSLEPAFAFDSQTAYVTTQFPGNGLGFGFLIAIETQ